MVTRQGGDKVGWRDGEGEEGSGELPSRGKYEGKWIGANHNTSNKTVAISTLDQLWNISLLRKNYLSNIYIFMDSP